MLCYLHGFNTDWKISYTGRKEKRIVKQECGSNLKILRLCFPWVFSDLSSKYLLRGCFNSWNRFFFFQVQFQVFFSLWLAVEGQGWFLCSLDWRTGLACGHFTPFGCSALLPDCAMDLLNSPSSILPLFWGWYISLKTSVHSHNILSLEKIWFKAKFEPADGKV